MTYIGAFSRHVLWGHAMQPLAWWELKMLEVFAGGWGEEGVRNFHFDGGRLHCWGVILSAI